MSVEITGSCIRCGACVWECPDDAIAPGAPTPVVSQDSCTECYGHFGESQCIVVCPVGAITRVAEPVEALAARYRRLHGEEPWHDVWIWSSSAVADIL